ncbi:hypothetical protein EZS27_003577 [termite gut metagenome]|uniref:Uncharacterized protein n=1 Tax=termite gut metagenome TaxID=433724 RepID=A0A5J4SSI6_9ZZZZ
MLFNRDNKGSEELRELTGNYFANNDFSKITGEIEIASEELATLIDKGIFEKVETAYRENSSDATDKTLIRKFQRPIAILATLNLYRKNDLSHEDDGRKFKIDDEHEKLPWEWQLDRDDEIHLEEYYKAVDALIRFLNESNIEEWKHTDRYKGLQALLIRSGAEFDNYFPINGSERTFLLLAPFIREVQILHIKRAYGDNWEWLLEKQEGVSLDAHFAACKATALLAMSLALSRMQLSLIPCGVIRRYTAENGAAKSAPAGTDEVRQIAAWLYEDAKKWINEMKQARDGGEITYNLLPDNSPTNKFFRA